MNSVATKAHKILDGATAEVERQMIVLVKDMNKDSDRLTMLHQLDALVRIQTQIRAIIDNERD